MPTAPCATAPSSIRAQPLRDARARRAPSTSGSPTPAIGSRVSVGWSSIGANAGRQGRVRGAAPGARATRRCRAGSRPVSTAPPRPVRGCRAPPPGRRGRAAARRAPAPPARRPTSRPPRPCRPAPAAPSSTAAASSAARSMVAKLVRADRLRAAVAGPVQRHQPDAVRGRDLRVRVERAVAGRGVGEQHDRRAGRGLRGQVVPGDPAVAGPDQVSGRVRRGHGAEVWSRSVTPCCHRFSGILGA